MDLINCLFIEKIYFGFLKREKSYNILFLVFSLFYLKEEKVGLFIYKFLEEQIIYS